MPSQASVSRHAPAPAAVGARAVPPALGGVSPEESDDDGWLSHNGLRLHLDMRLCEVDGLLLDLTRSEFELLAAIMVGRRRVVSKTSLALDMRGDDAGGGGYVSESDRRAVEVHLANLRRKLSDSVSAPRFIETVRGVGYRLAVRQQGGVVLGS